MKLTGPIVAILVCAQIEDLRQQGLLFLEQAELTVKREGNPVRLAHGAIVLAGLAKEIEPNRCGPLLRLAAQALSGLEVESALQREKRQTGKMPRVVFRSPYDADRLWEAVLEQAASCRIELVRELMAGIRGSELWKGHVLARLARSVKDDARTWNELIELSVSQAVSFEIIGLLFELREKDPERGRAIFRSALERAVVRRDLGGLYWLGAYAIPGVNLPNRFPLADPPAPDPLLARMYIPALVDVLSGVIARVGPIPSHVYRALVNIRPYAEQFAPEVVLHIDNLLALVVNRLSPEAIAEAERSDLERMTPRAERIEDLERQALRAKDEAAFNDLMAQAAFLALQSQDFERALSLAAKIKDRIVRNDMRDLINFRAAVELSKTERRHQAEAHALAIEHPERLAVAVADVLRELEDKTQAALLIAHAQARIERLQTEGSKGRAFLYLAEPVMSFDADQGRFFLTRAIDLFNATRADLNGAADAVIRIETGEFLTGVVVGSNDLSSVVIRAFRRLVEGDPELIHAPALAARWESAEIRAIAQAVIAHALVERAKRHTPSVR